MQSPVLSAPSLSRNVVDVPYIHSSSPSSVVEVHDGFPTQFYWPAEDLVSALAELNVPLIDISGFLVGDDELALQAAKSVREACLSHGFFKVTNHGIDQDLIQAAYDHISDYFRSPIEIKLRCTKTKTGVSGYSSAHSERFTTKLPWKETLSFAVSPSSPNEEVFYYFLSHLGLDFELTGKVFQKYSEAMTDLALKIMELVAISLGVDRHRYREFFEDSSSIMRCNYYPACKFPSQVLGTGPHCDPNSLTILHQDQVGGLEVFVNDKWYKVGPHPNALVINIGDTLMAMSNGIYKSCLHRAAVNETSSRMSLAFFFSPAMHKVVKPEPELLQGDNGEILERKYPDFTWSDFLRFAKENYRIDGDSLLHFSKWMLARPPVPSVADHLNHLETEKKLPA